MDSIVTNRLEIRRFRETDEEQYIKIMTNPMVTNYLADGSNKTEADIKKMMNHFESIWSKHGFGVFVVVESESGDVIGHCGFLPMKDGWELLYAFDVSAWGKGYATEAGKAVLKYAEKQIGQAKIYAITWPQNTASISTLTKLGFLNTGQREYFGILMEEFEWRKRLYETM